MQGVTTSDHEAWGQRTIVESPQDTLGHPQAQGSHLYSERGSPEASQQSERTHLNRHGFGKDRMMQKPSGSAISPEQLCYSRQRQTRKPSLTT